MNWLGLSFGTLPGSTDPTEDEDAGAENRRRKKQEKRDKPSSTSKRTTVPPRGTPHTTPATKTTRITTRKPIVRVN